MLKTFLPSGMLTVTALLSVILGWATATPLAARERQLLDDGWRFHLNEADGNSAVAPAGLPVTQWVWIADDNATNDAATMAAPGLDPSTWTNFTIGADVFHGRLGYAWFRTTIIASQLSYQPAGIYFSGVDDNAWVYLNGVLVGQHAGWSEPFSVSPLNPAWIVGGTNVLAVAVQNTGGPGGIYASVLLQSATSQIQPPGIPVTRWVWQADSNAPDDWATMTATNLDTSTWPTALIGQDVFNGASGAAWFRARLNGLATPNRPLTLHFLAVADSTSIYLNGVLLGRHAGGGQPFDLSVPGSAWSVTGPNILAVAVQNSSGPGGLLEPVILQSGNQVPPPGIPVDGWLWLADNSAPADAATMTVTNLDTSGWSDAAPGQDLFGDGVSALWLRAGVDAFATGGRPLILHFLNLGSNVTASVFLNGTSLGQFTGAFDLPIPDNVWVSSGPNILAVALQNSGGAGGILNPVLLQSGDDIQDFSPANPDFNDSTWRTVHLPHDYVIEGAFTPSAETSHASLPLANAWYRLKFPVPADAQGQSAWIDFDGVYHKSRVWLNGHYLGYWYSGYAPFRYDVSRFILPGQTNVLAVHVDPHGDEGWWYEGAGIYRHVWLTIANPLHVAPWGTFVTSAVQGPDANGHASATLTITTTVTNADSQAQACVLSSQAMGPDGISAGAVLTTMTVPGGAGTNLVQTIQVADAKLWSLDTPQLYALQTSLQQSNQTVDAVSTPFGIRSIHFDANKGFFLNGKRVEIQGMCNHQDFAGVGIAIPDNLLYWRIMKLKEMGANAYRCAHNPPTAALLDACDRLGMLVMDENRHLGDATGAYSSANAQTTYADLAPLSNMIQRDRNHPSIILWSMCNEESISGTQAGADIFYAMKKRVEEYDTSRPVSCAMNGGWFNVGISLVEDVEGFNYSPGLYDSFHQQFPSQPMYGSETSSAMADRGEYASDGVAYLSSYSSPEGAWQPVVTRPFVAGSFTWTGFDYKGEPSPYGWPCISSKFGVMDLCGLPKDMYYYYQAWWRNQPLVHILPHWNWSTNQTITVWCYANSASVELLLNGVSQGAQTMPAYGHVAWSVPYAPGMLVAKGYDSSGNVIATDQVETTGAPASVKLTTDRTTLTADDEDVTVVYASIVDAQGRVVPTASNLVAFAVSGPAYVDGVGNGDPASHEPDKASQRHAFNGWCMALIGATNSAGAISLTAISSGLTSATLNLQANATNSAPVTPTNLTANAGNAQVNLRWDLLFGATSYNVKRATASGGPFSTVANTTAIGFDDNGLTNGVTYFYMVSAINAYGESADSASVSATPIAPAIPTPPTALVAQRDDGQVLLNWNSVSGAAGYYVKRASTAGGPYIAITNVAETSYADDAVTNGATYFYVVSAMNNSGESGDSTPVSATPASMGYLVGSSIGSSGSWQDSGNIREMALDGNLNTFFDPSNADASVGIDLGTNITRTICKIRYAPRVGYESRMVGGMFQGANQPDFTDAVTLYTITNSPADGFTACFPTNTAAFRYLRYLTAPNNWCNLSELEFYSLGPHNYKLSGTVIGTSGSWNNGGDTITNAVDGDITTYFDGPTSDGDWVGLDIGAATPIANIRFFPRLGNADRMNGGIFQVANASDFSDALNLWTLTNPPPDSTFTARVITNTTPFRYLRYLAPSGSYGDVAEVQFFGPSPGAPATLSPPTGLTATPGNQEVALSWNSDGGGTSYIVKRSLVSGGPYDIVGSTTATLYMDVDLSGGTYIYVVSAVNTNGESINSAEAAATVNCSVPPVPTGLAGTAENSQVRLAWAPVSTGTSPTTYNVLRATNTAGPYSLLAVNVNGTNFCDQMAIDGFTYYYQIQAVNACGPSESSSPLPFASLSLPELNVGVVGDQLRLSWPSWAGNYLPYTTTSLTPPITWQPVTNSLESTNGILSLVLPITSSPQQFFRLIAP